MPMPEPGHPFGQSVIGECHSVQPPDGEIPTLAPHIVGEGSASGRTRWWKFSEVAQRRLPNRSKTLINMWNREQLGSGRRNPLGYGGSKFSGPWPKAESVKKTRNFKALQLIRIHFPIVRGSLPLGKILV